MINKVSYDVKKGMRGYQSYKIMLSYNKLNKRYNNTSVFHDISLRDIGAKHETNINIPP